MKKLSLDQIARNMYLSPFSHIQNFYKSETGDTPINHLIKSGWKRPGFCLTSRRMPAYRTLPLCVGYDDAYHFSKLFKKHFGESPSKYRKKQE